MITNPSNDDERHNPENQFLRVDGYNTIIQAKNAVDADPQCTNKVSCADIMALAARDAVLLVMLFNLSEFYCAIFLDQNMRLICWVLCGRVVARHGKWSLEGTMPWGQELVMSTFLRHPKMYPN